MDIAHVIAVWFHTLAFVIAWGYYGILGRMVLPALQGSLQGTDQSAALVAIEGRALPLVGGSVVLFLITGSYLLVVDPEYAGLGNIASTWATLMLVKHLVIVALVVAGIDIDRRIRRLAETTDEGARTASMHRIRLGAEVATGLGALVALLTAAAQAAA
jgi:uncharacterized membrane protein